VTPSCCLLLALFSDLEFDNFVQIVTDIGRGKKHIQAGGFRNLAVLFPISRSGTKAQFFPHRV